MAEFKLKKTYLLEKKIGLVRKGKEEVKRHAQMKDAQLYAGREMGYSAWVGRTIIPEF